MERFAIPTPTKAVHDRVVGLVNRILAAKGRNPETDTIALKNEIDELVYALYGLTPEEVKLVENAAK